MSLSHFSPPGNRSRLFSSFVKFVQLNRDQSHRLASSRLFFPTISHPHVFAYQAVRSSVPDAPGPVRSLINLVILNILICIIFPENRLGRTAGLKIKSHSARAHTHTPVLSFEYSIQFRFYKWLKQFM